METLLDILTAHKDKKLSDSEAVEYFSDIVNNSETSNTAINRQLTSAKEQSLVGDDMYSRLLSLLNIDDKTLLKKVESSESVSEVGDITRLSVGKSAQSTKQTQNDRTKLVKSKKNAFQNPEKDIVDKDGIVKKSIVKENIVKESVVKESVGIESVDKGNNDRVKNDRVKGEKVKVENFKAQPNDTTKLKAPLHQDDSTKLKAKAKTNINSGSASETKENNKTVVKKVDATEVATTNKGQKNSEESLDVTGNPSWSKNELDQPTTINTDKTLVTSPVGEAAESTVEVGGTIKDRFVIEAPIGEGGMGSVFKARDLRKEEMHDESSLVAIKILNTELRDQPEALIALQREAKKSQALAHPNIVTVYDFDRDGELVYLVMEFLQGKTFDELVATQYCSRLPREKIMSIIEYIARGLAYAHQQGYAHADLKPSNIFLTSDGNVKLLDFGIAQAVRVNAEHQSPHDSQYDAYTLGAITPNFASPEMLDEKSPLPSDDMYSLGCVAYALLTGEHPFLDDKGHKLTAKQAQKQSLSVKTIPDLSRRHMQAIRRCLNFDGQQRFQNAGEFIDAIKPKVKLRRWVVVLLAVLSVALFVSWWITVEQSDVVVGFDDLPSSMTELVNTIELGDKSFATGDIDQAHKLYAQAWESSFELNELNPRDQSRLKIIVDRRIDKVTGYLLEQAELPNLDEFRLLQLQIALEFLQQGEVGTMDKQIDQQLVYIKQKLEELKQ